jgi:hypothetical protein
MTHYHCKSFIHLENQELIDKLIEKGYQDIVDAFLTNDNKVYTKKGRLNKSGACRVLKCKPKDLEERLRECQELLVKELGDLLLQQDEQD